MHLQPSTIQLCMCTVRFSWWWLCPYCGRETSQALSVVTYPSHVTRDKCSGIICVDIVTYVLFIQRQSSSECLLLGAHFCLHLWCIEGVFQFVSIAASRVCWRAWLLSCLIPIRLFPRSFAPWDPLFLLTTCNIYWSVPHYYSLLSYSTGSCASQSPFPPLFVLILTR